MDTSDTAVDQNASTPTLDPSARAFVLVINQNAILCLVAGKKVIHECSLYYCVFLTKVVFLSCLLFTFQQCLL